MKTFKYFISFLILCFFTVRLYAQTPKIDSLKNLIVQPVDHQQLPDMLIMLAEQYYYIDKDTSVFYSTQAFELAKSNNNKEQQAKALKTIGNVSFLRGQLDHALSNYEDALGLAKEIMNLEVEVNILIPKASVEVHLDRPLASVKTNERKIEIYRQLGDSLGVAEAMLDLVDIYQPRGDFDAYEIYLYQAESILLEQGEKGRSLLITVYKNKGNTYAIREGNYIKGAEFLLEALRISEELDELNQQMAVLASLGSVYRSSDDHEQAVFVYRKLVKLHEENGITVNINLAYQRLARALNSRGLRSESISCYRKAIAYAISGNNVLHATSTSAQLAVIYLQEGIIDSAVHYYQYADKHFEERNYDVGFAMQLCSMGEYNRQVRNFLLAEEFYLKALEVGNAVDYGAVHSAAKGLHQVYAAQGDYQEAYKYALLKSEVSDSINNKEQVREVTRLQAKFEHDKEITSKKNEIVLLESEQQNANLKMTILIIIIGLVIVIAFLVARVLLIKKERKKKELEEIAQFKEAMTGMIAHDLKNPLGVILGTESEQPSTRNMARQMLSLVENMLDVHKFEKAEVKLVVVPISLKDLSQEAMQQVTTLQEEKNINIEPSGDQNLQVLGDREMLLRVMINLLTNAIKYSENNSTISILAAKAEQGIQILVRDQGSGIPGDRIDEIFHSYAQIDPRASGFTGSTGLGLTFCKLAIEAHDSSIQVDTEVGKGTTFSFILQQAGLKEEAPSETENYKLIIPEGDRKLILELLPTLRAYKMHQAMQMEDLLKPLGKNHEATQKWVDAILNAAYLGNKAHFAELVEEIEQA